MRTKDVDPLLDEVRLLFHVLVRAGDALHAGEEVSMGMRAVLEFVSVHGPAPVPVIARRRRVSRQHVQALVNPLLEKRLLRTAPNPDHRRSPLVELTAAGARALARMRRREARVFEEASPRIPAARLREATECLRKLRGALESAI